MDGIRPKNKSVEGLDLDTDEKLVWRLGPERRAQSPRKELPGFKESGEVRSSLTRQGDLAVPRAWRDEARVRDSGIINTKLPGYMHPRSASRVTASHVALNWPQSSQTGNNVNIPHVTVREKWI